MFWIADDQLMASFVSSCKRHQVRCCHWCGDECWGWWKD